LLGIQARHDRYWHISSNCFSLAQRPPPVGVDAAAATPASDEGRKELRLPWVPISLSVDRSALLHAAKKLLRYDRRYFDADPILSASLYGLLR
jgi:hypothetical protein